MTRRELVKAAIQHRETERVPYKIQLCPEAWERLQPVVGVDDCEAFLDNDVAGLGPPWWTWHDLAPDWQGMDPPTSRATVIGTGSYNDFVDRGLQAIINEVGELLIEVEDYPLKVKLGTVE